MTSLKVILFLMLVAFIGCNEAVDYPSGTIDTLSFHSVTLKRTIKYQVYRPPTYNSTTSTYPVLYLLHGHGGDERDWFQMDEGNAKHLLDSLICTQTIPPMVAVSLGAGNSWYVDRPELMETFYLGEFMPLVESTYAIDTTLSRTIAGNSAGGYGALRFLLKDPSLFDNVILLSPASYEPLPPPISSSRKVEAFALDGTFNDSIWNSFSYTRRWDNLLNAPRKPHYYLFVGDDDVYNIVPVVTRLQQQMLKDSIPNELRIINGGHDWDCWRGNFVEALTAIYK